MKIIKLSDYQQVGVNIKWSSIPRTQRRFLIIHEAH